jgi:hypothetical protein
LLGVGSWPGLVGWLVWLVLVVIFCLFFR